MMTVECLHFMGRFSQLAKQDGFLVSMAPAESYLDPTRQGFDRSLLHSYDEWNSLHPDFTYHGLNTYAPLLSSEYKYTLVDGRLVDTFDWVMIQLYEGYSHTNYQIRQKGRSTSDCLL